MTEQKAREFFMYWHFYDGEYRVYETSQQPSYSYDIKEIHVVEYSALQAANEQIKFEKQAKYDLGEMHDEMCELVDKLEAKLERAKSALIKIRSEGYVSGEIIAEIVDAALADLEREAIGEKVGE
jgi:hypothetical protein